MALPPGVEIQEESSFWTVGISITGKQTRSDGKFDFFSGTATGFPYSSANNPIWGGTHWYKVILHCTSNRCHGTDAVGPPLDCAGSAIDDRARRAEIAGARSADSSAEPVLAARDPGGRVGGNTIVIGGTGGTIYAVPDRANYILDLGSHQSVLADGAGNDQVGALGKDVTIRAGSGRDLIYGGAGGTLIGGSGHDTLADVKGDATVLVRGSDNEVVVSGHGDRVSCALGSRDDVIYDAVHDSVNRICHSDHARVRPDSRLHAPGLARLAAATTIEGNGSNEDPFVAPCTTVTKPHFCTVSVFPERPLSGLWANEYVPAYRCPDDHPYLLNQDYSPGFGTVIPHGVEIAEDWGAPWPIGISITATVKPPGSGFIGYTYGTATGFPRSSATNWTTGSHHYKVIFHCTDLTNFATIF